MTTTNQTKKIETPKMPLWVRAIDCICKFVKVAFWSDIVFELINSTL